MSSTPSTKFAIREPCCEEIFFSIFYHTTYIPVCIETNRSQPTCICPVIILQANINMWNLTITFASTSSTTI